MKNLFMSLLLVFPLFAADLTLKEGFVAAHTEMLMDSTIDPLNNALHATLSMKNNDPATLSGKLWIEMQLFSSDNAERDEHMHEANEVAKFPLATYTLKKAVHQKDDSYTLEGELEFHGQHKAWSMNAQILNLDDTLTINATSSFLVSDFGMEMPCMVFMCVRDQVDIFAKAVLLKQ